MDLPADTRLRQLTTAGTFSLDSVIYMVDSHRAFEQVLVINNGDTIIVADLHGEVLAEHTRHQIRRQRPTPRPTPQRRRTVTEVLTHQLSPMS